MKAMLSRRAGGPDTLELAELPDPTPGAGEVVIAVKACGVNYPDSLIIEDRYQFKPPRPFAPGGEVAGLVDAVGAGVTAYKPGDRVIGSLVWGGMAEKVALPAARCTPMPEGMPFDEASALVLTYGTSIHAIKDRARLKAGETMLVLGAAGGVGLSAVELGKAYRRARDRRGVLAGEGGPRQAARRRRGRGVSGRALRQGRRQGAGGPVQGRLRREGRRCGLRPGRRRLFGGGAARHRLGGPPPGGGLPGRHPEVAAQPDAAEGLPGGGRVLGRLHAARPQGQRRQHRGADATLRQGRHQAARVRALSPRPRRRGDRAPLPAARPWASSS